MQPNEPATNPPTTDTAARLLAQFDGRVRLTDILATVRQAQTDLSDYPAAALPELVERLAHQRLIEEVDRTQDGVRTP